MLKSQELSEPNSCLNKARDDELLFVLLERDVAAPAAVLAWIEARIRLGKNAYNDPQIVEARQWVDRVQLNARPQTPKFERRNTQGGGA